MTCRPIAVCALGFSLAAGMGAPTPAQDARPARPQGEALRVEVLPAELEALLKTWEKQSAGIRTITGKHTRSDFNEVFAVETRSVGQFFFEAPDKGRIDMKGADVKPGTQSSRKDKQGVPYRVQPGHEERWICTGKDILQINDQAKELELLPIPPEFQGENIIRSPLPFLFGLKAEEAKRRFRFELITTKSAEYYSLKVEPRTSQDAFRLAYVKLDRRLFVPTAVILFDPAGTLETRYEFTDIKINDNGIGRLVSEMFGRDPFHPTLVGYKRVQASVQNTAGQGANGQQPPILPASQKQTSPLPRSAPASPPPTKTVQPRSSTIR